MSTTYKYFYSLVDEDQIKLEEILSKYPFMFYKILETYNDNTDDIKNKLDVLNLKTITIYREEIENLTNEQKQKLSKLKLQNFQTTIYPILKETVYNVINSYLCNTCDKSFEYSEKVICLIKHIDITDPKSKDNSSYEFLNNSLENILNTKLVKKFSAYIEDNKLIQKLIPNTLRKQFEDINPTENYETIINKDIKNPLYNPDFVHIDVPENKNIQGKIILDTEVDNVTKFFEISRAKNSFKYNLSKSTMNDFKPKTGLNSIELDEDFTVYQFHLKIEPIEPFEYDNGEIDEEKQQKYIDFICNISDDILDDQGILNDKCVIIQQIMSMIKTYFISNNIIFNCTMKESCNAGERYRHLYF